jgi:hypothetical protein
MKTISAAGALAHASTGALEAARLRLMDRLRSQTPVGTRDWARYDLYQLPLGCRGLEGFEVVIGLHGPCAFD